MGRKRKLELNTSITNTNESSNSSGKDSHSSLSLIQRSAANDRERTRMRVLSKAFVRLKTSLPWVPADTKLSKLDTLKLATSYISYLTRILLDDENKSDSASQINSIDPFPATNVTFQKFNINTRLFSNIRFNCSEKQKKMIQHLSSTSNAKAVTTNTNSSHNNNNNNIVINTKNVMQYQNNDYVRKISLLFIIIF
jgi:hypothetical protein